MDSQKFNKWFSAFILIGMTLALVVVTALKLKDPGVAKALLLVSAFGSLMGVLSTVCSANGLIITFFFGLLDVSIYGIMCFVNWRHGNPGLGNALLHAAYFVPMQFVGFAQWRRRGASTAGEAVKAKRLNGRQWLLVSATFLLGTVVSYLVIAQFDKPAADSFIRYAVLLDVLPLMCNIFGQMLMSMAYMEQWIYWIGVNIFSIAMWLSSMHGQADSFAVVYVIKYSFYMLNSINGLRVWLGLSRSGEVCSC